MAPGSGPNTQMLDWNILFVFPGLLRPMAHHVTGPTTGGGKFGGVHSALIVTVPAAASVDQEKQICEPSVPPLLRQIEPAIAASGRVSASKRMAESMPEVR